MKVFIITGASRGLGESIASLTLSENDCRIICISRNNSETLLKKAAGRNAILEYYPFDLNRLTEIPDLMQRIFKSMEPSKISSLSLINNAGMLNPVKYLENTEPADIISNVQVNLSAPLLLNASFIQLSKKWKARRNIVNITSGVSLKPRASWSCYGAAKAGLDIVTKTIALEQGEAPNAVRVISIHPGIMDTSMRKENLKARTIWKKLAGFVLKWFHPKTEDAVHPDVIAQAVLDILADPDVKSGMVVEANHYIKK